MFAIVEISATQHQVEPGQKIKVAKLEEEVGKALKFDKVLLFNDDKGKVTPMEIEFTDIEEEDKTKIVIKEIEYDIELSSSFFSIRTLKKPTL